MSVAEHGSPPLFDLRGDLEDAGVCVRQGCDEPADALFIVQTRLGPRYVCSPQHGAYWP